MTLTEFLRARLDDDASFVLSATPGEWSVTKFGLKDEDAAFVSRFHQLRMLEDTRAKNVIFRSVEAVEDASLRSWLIEAILKPLAEAYEDHPDFDPAWRDPDRMRVTTTSERD